MRDDVQVLGSFGTATPPAAPDDTRDAEALPTLAFDWYGSRIRVSVDASEVDLIEFMGEAGDVDERDPKAIPAFYRLFRRLVHPDDWQTFWGSFRVHRATVAEDLLPLLDAIMRAVTGRPTAPPSASTPGPAPTAARSTGGSVSRVLDSLVDRPDLAEFVVMAQDYQARGTD